MSALTPSRTARALGLAARLLPPPAVDGIRLDPMMAAGLRAFRLARRPALETLTPAAARAEIRTLLGLLNPGRPLPLPLVTEQTLPGPAGPLRLRRYPATPRRTGPALLFLHGGGHVVGDLETHDPLCRLLAARSGVPVLALDYRLAPEHRFPAAFDDALAAFRALRDGAADLGVDPRRLALGGDSAGANLAAAVALAAARAGEPGPALQLLFYPLVDAVPAALDHPAPPRSYTLFGRGFGLDRETIAWYRAHYLGPDGDPTDLRISPLRAPDLRGVAPAWVATAGFDPLRDDGAAWVDALSAAGVRAVHAPHPRFTHGFATFTGLHAASHAAVLRAADVLRDALQ